MDFSQIRERARTSLRNFRNKVYALVLSKGRQPSAFWGQVQRLIDKLEEYLKAPAKKIAQRAWQDLNQAHAQADPVVMDSPDEAYDYLMLYLASPSVFQRTEKIIWRLSIRIEGEARKAYCIDQLKGGDGGEDKSPSKERVEATESLLQRDGFAEQPSPISVAKDDAKKKKAEEQLAQDLRLPVFFLASSHADSAKDHVEAQGRIYLDKRWTEKIKSEELREAVRSQKDLRGMQYYQDIVYRPTWLVTRPNCRHYFTPLKTEEVIGGLPTTTLLDRHGMNHDEGLNAQQTIKHSTRKEWYTEENVANILRRYYARRDYHKSLGATDAVRKDELLIQRWRFYYRKAFNKNFSI